VRVTTVFNKLGLIQFGGLFDYATNRSLTYPQKLDGISL
jgi:hypothetical protein